MPVVEDGKQATRGSKKQAGVESSQLINLSDLVAATSAKKEKGNQSKGKGGKKGSVVWEEESKEWEAWLQEKEEKLEEEAKQSKAEVGGEALTDDLTPEEKEEL